MIALRRHPRISPQRCRAAARVAVAAALIVAGATADGIAGAPCQTGPGLFDYGPHRDDPEAEQLAMHLTGQLRAPDEEYDRIRRDLALIRGAYPVLEAVVDDPDYAPNELLVRLDPGLPWSGYAALNEHYQVVYQANLFGDWYQLRFCDNLNAPVLAAIYAGLAEVQFAEPNSVIGADDEISVAVFGATYEYLIVDGFHDCTDGCDCERGWAFGVSEAGEVDLQNYAENDNGWSWCEFEDTSCCAQGACATQSIQACVFQGGSPLAFDTICEGDPDQDGVDTVCGDNCPFLASPDFTDSDSDQVGDVCDNCPNLANPLQPDDDEDLVGDACDNCWLDPNPAQGDWDEDAEGDVCDLNDALVYVRFESAERFEWQDEIWFGSWNVYRGDLAVLFEAGVYSQAPGSNPLASRWCDLAEIFLEDETEPPLGQAAFFLTSGTSLGQEGDLGHDSEGELRPNEHPCP